MSKAIAINSVLEHYRILSQIGVGGMGEVYLAEDSRLNRKVALKILPGNVAEHHDRMKRFVQEAKAASALNHPNIITIHEIGQDNGHHFIATEYVDGQTLRTRLASGPITPDEAIKIASQIANALDRLADRVGA